MNNAPAVLRTGGILLLMLITTTLAAYGDTISLKSGLRYVGITVLQLDHRRIVFRQNTADHVLDLREVRSVEFAPRAGETDSVHLRSGTTIVGKIVQVAYDSLTMTTAESEEPFTIPSSEIVSALGKQTYLTYRAADGSSFLLVSRTVYFEAGKPKKSFYESPYRLTVSALLTQSTAKAGFGPTGSTLGYPLPGMGVTIEIEQQLNERDALLYSFLYEENSFAANSSLGSRFSAWKNAFVAAGFRRYFTAAPFGNDVVFIEAKVGGLLSTPPQNDTYVYDQAFAIAWSAGCGWFVTERTSISLGYTAATTQFNHLEPKRQTPPVNVGGHISLLALGINYSIGNGF